MTKLKHYDDLGTARFITFGCYRQEAYLADRRAKELFIAELNNARSKHQFKILGYVIMPNHVHLVLFPPEGMKMGLVIGEIKSKMAREYFSREACASDGIRVFWNKRCYDHNCRTPAAVGDKINYCHNNPVRQGLVTAPGDYKWSSYNWYSGLRDVPLTIDEYEP